MLPSPAMLKAGAIAIALIASFFFGVRYEAGVVAKERLEEQNAKVDKTNEVIKTQGAIAQKAQEKTNDLQKRYDGVVSAWRDSVRQSENARANNDPTAAIQGRGIGLSGADGKFLIGFARSCQQSENERNTLIGLYDSLSK